MKIAWHSFDLRTGRRGPRLVTQNLGTVKRKLVEATEFDVVVRCWDEENQRVQPGWEEGTLPLRTMLVALDEDNDDKIICGGVVRDRRSSKGVWVSCPVTTLESYFSRRFAGDVVFQGIDQATIASDLITTYAMTDGPSFVVDAPPSGQLRDRQYKDAEDKTLGSILEELHGVENGPEWTVELRWVDAEHTVLEPVVPIRNRIGVSPVHPTRWTMPGCITDFNHLESYAVEYGANDVLATSSGEGDVRPTSQHVVATDLLANGWCRLEYRWSPSTSISDTTTLDSHARQKAAEMRDGLTQLSIVADLATAPRLGQDWSLGDDIEVALTCPRFPERIGPDGERVPGYLARIRITGVDIDLDKGVITPTSTEADS